MIIVSQYGNLNHQHMGTVEWIKNYGDDTILYSEQLQSLENSQVLREFNNQRRGMEPGEHEI